MRIPEAHLIPPSLQAEGTVVFPMWAIEQTQSLRTLTETATSISSLATAAVAPSSLPTPATPLARPSLPLHSALAYRMWATRQAPPLQTSTAMVTSICSSATKMAAPSSFATPVRVVSTAPPPTAAMSVATPSRSRCSSRTLSRLPVHPPCNWKPAVLIKSPPTPVAVAPISSASPIPCRLLIAALIWTTPAPQPLTSMAARSKMPPVTAPASRSPRLGPKVRLALMLPW